MMGRLFSLRPKDVQRLTYDEWRNYIEFAEEWMKAREKRG